MKLKKSGKNSKLEFRKKKFVRKPLYEHAEAEEGKRQFIDGRIYVDCGLCGKWVHHTKLCNDHNHYTGKLRGWICHNCNSMLGFAHDDINTLMNAIEYLKNTMDVDVVNGLSYRNKKPGRRW
jgi:hypothetical protein